MCELILAKRLEKYFVWDKFKTERRSHTVGYDPFIKVNLTQAINFRASFGAKLVMHPAGSKPA